MDQQQLILDSAETTEAGTEAVIQNVSNLVLAALKESDNITINIKVRIM